MAAALLLFLSVQGCFAVEFLILGGEWNLDEANGKYKNLQAEVPGGVYSDLMNNGVIGDVMYGSNDTETRWVAQTNWTYSLNFTVNDDFPSHENVNLIFEGVDTFSTILLNDVQLGETQNMFLPYIFDVKNNLKPGDNSLKVRFTSPIWMANLLALKQNYSVPPECTPLEYRGECHVNQIRKMQASFAWDWGPALPSMGLWKDVYLEASDCAVIRYVVVDVREADDDSWMVKISTYLNGGRAQKSVGNLSHKIQTDVSLIQEFLAVERTGNEIKVDVNITIPKLAVKRWWPNGYGGQTLYNLVTEFKSGSEVSQKTTRIGFRTIDLVQEDLIGGLSFYFKVNGVPIFAKGANEIPLDILPERGQNHETVRRVLEAAARVNMNMIRVWGGGVYESDFFYDKADEMGILIWQDFMFACAMYPTYPEFLSNVIAEVRHQVRRINNHPSIALWAGNNENEVALSTNWYGTASNFTLYKNDFVKLYVDTIKAELENNIDAIFLTSSPTNGKESEKEGYLAKNPQDPLYGDVHFYNYLANSLVFSTYPIPRFASEFGYQSLPDIDAWLTVTHNLTDLQPAGAFIDHRQHHLLGYAENTLLIAYQLNMNLDSPNYYKTHIFYSQIVQALSIKFEVEYYRSFMRAISSDRGFGFTMGALYWQLNDVWVAPTWSGIDYTGKWKMLHYLAKNFFASTIVTGYLSIDRVLRVFVVSEETGFSGSYHDVQVVIEVYNWNNFTPIDSQEHNISIEYGRSIQVTLVATDDYLSKIGCGSLGDAQNNCFFYMSVKDANGTLSPFNYVFPAALKKCLIEQANVTIDSVTGGGWNFEITVRTDAIAVFVWLDSHAIKGVFTENGFLQVRSTKTVSFEAETATTSDELRKVLTITHLKDTEIL